MTPVLFLSLRFVNDMPGNDLVEVAAARCDALDGNPIEMYTARIRSNAAATGAPSADPPDAVYLADAMNRLRELGRGCVLTAWQATVTRQQLDELCARWELEPMSFAANTIDLASLAWPLAMVGDARSARLEDVLTALGLTVTTPTAPLEELRLLRAVYDQVLDRSQASSRLNQLAPEDRELIEALTQRLGAVSAPPGTIVIELSPTWFAEHTRAALQAAKDRIVAVKDRVVAALPTKDTITTAVKTRWKALTQCLGFGSASS